MPECPCKEISCYKDYAFIEGFARGCHETATALVEWFLKHGVLRTDFKDNDVGDLQQIWEVLTLPDDGVPRIYEILISVAELKQLLKDVGLEDRP